MKHVFAFGLALCAVCLLGSCKSKESAYRQAYEKAKLQQNTSNNEATTVTVAPTTNEQQAVSVTPVNPNPAPEDNSDVRTIAGGVTVVAGEPLRTYSVVVGSFITQANAEGLMSQLRSKGYAARVVKTNEPSTTTPAGSAWWPLHTTTRPRPSIHATSSRALTPALGCSIINKTKSLKDLRD